MAEQDQTGSATEIERDDSALVMREPIHDQILPHIRRAIVESRFGPGERLSEPLLCRQYGISRTPLRQVLKSLEAEGLVRLVPHVGAIVTDPDVEDLGEKMDVLMALEQLAATRVAQARRPRAVARIQRIYDKMCKAAETGDAAAYYQLNDTFHRAIVTGCENATLETMHQNIMWHVHRERHRVNTHEPFSVHAAEHHAAIVDAIAAGDGDAAGRAMRQHLEDVARVLMAHRKAHGGA
ncbi:GntR family transcriptional regulator [Aquabacter spiritensis]|uniref:DNA-binding GntR family transcriptional regulator n=1 Tax=Aquabacter spiritensis TaxID=933073 RepID=A0A4R3LNK1_9HYPH|nr:GntR family transcriptional regulator [Aquabacter spiritensis]TCT01731.1 DNA-binding GntR family transcriptional regulator [Aquabacter spiritensis]